VFPKSDYAFLVHVARNVAAAFDAIHHYGHVIGDVNQGNLLVARDGRVRLIDCDSFQIMAGGVNHLCEVGVPIFTPPELQGLGSFKGITRSPNHDNFGLALLVFHLLHMGRHPFSGVFNQGRGDMPLERAIAEFRFAYGANRRAKQVDMPPLALPMDLLPRQVADLFERAFSEEGAATTRPTASEWVSGLDSMRQGLKTCGAEPIHKFASHLGVCPWCEMERKGGTQFFLPILLVTVGPGISPGTIAELWSRIQSVPPPILSATYSPPTRQAIRRPPPADRQRARWAYLILKPGALAALAGGLIALPNLAVLWIGLGILLSVKFRHPYRQVRKERKTVLEALSREFEKKQRQLREATSIKPFTDLQQQFWRVKQEFDRLEPAHKVERQKLRDSLRNKQLQKHLERFFIRQANITGIGTGRMTVLESFGVETAADVDEWKIRRIPGFGPKLTNELVDWRRRMESRFRFDPQQGVDQREEQQLQARFNQQAAKLREALHNGHIKLQQLRNDMSSRVSTMRASLDETAVAVQQAQEDVRAVSGW
jgi:DNA-binding helix-hairpin-helix protein with protein kinase domain